MTHSERYFNRELAWLEFNERVLQEAQDPDVPLVERVKFLAITGSNLDEFFRVRVGELVRRVVEGAVATDPSGRTPDEQLRDVRARAYQMLSGLDTCYEQLESQLAAADWPRLNCDTLTTEQRSHAQSFFTSDVLATLSPLAVDSLDGDIGRSAAAGLQGEIVTIAVQLQSNDLFGGETRFALLPLAKVLSRFYFDRSGYVLLEDLVKTFVHRFFVGQSIAGVAAFRLTRDADITVDDDDADDLVSDMRDVLDARKRGRVVRLEIESGAGQLIVDMLTELYDVDDAAVVRPTSPLGVSAWFGLVPRGRLLDERDAEWAPVDPAWLDDDDLFAAIRDKDRLAVHPYETFEPVIRFLESAAVDPDVIAIKQTLYRTAQDSRIVSALIQAAKNGKHVTVLVELKARFDEARNIDRAKELEEAGVFVTYGVRGLKTHAKLCLVARRESAGTIRYVHLGTGNYNESTARLYGDISLFTTDPDIGHDAVAVFNAITGFSEPHSLRKLRWAPINLRERVVELIAAEAERARQGQQAWIRIKLNSLVDPEVIDALYEASSAGVEIEINVRGICCLRPNVRGLSENIRVTRLVDRFLEHARIFAFAQGGENSVFISSADWMPRNLDRRIELLVPVEDEDAKEQLLDVLKICINDTVKATELMPDGSQKRITAKSGKAPKRAQEILWRETTVAVETATSAAKTRFVPHEPSSK